MVLRGWWPTNEWQKVPLLSCGVPHRRAAEKLAGKVPRHVMTKYSNNGWLVAAAAKAAWHEEIIIVSRIEGDFGALQSCDSYSRILKCGMRGIS